MLALALLASPAQAAFPGSNGRLAFSDVRAPEVGSPSIFSINPDGSDLKALTYTSDFPDVLPAWSPNGTRIAYASLSGIRVMNFDGSGSRAVFTTSVGGTPTQPSWSPDGTEVLYVWSNAIRAVNADGSGGRIVLSGSSPAFPEWSPDGSKIAFTRFRTGRGVDIYTINPDGTGLTSLTADVAAGSSMPNWSPDGSKLAFTNSSNVWTMNADGTGKTVVKTFAQYPAWSPDGSRIAYFTFGDDVRVMDPDGTNDSLVVSGQGAGGVDWQPCQGTCPVGPELPGYDVPGAANRAYIKFVPNYRQTISDTQCAARGGTASTHGAPLSLSSCNPPAYSPGTVAHQGPGGESGVIYRRGDGFGTTGDGFNLEGGGTDIRNAAGGDYNPAPGADATLTVKVRLTDVFSGPDLNVPATVSDFELGLPVSCSPDPDPEFGSTCAAAGATEAFMPEAIRAGRHAVIQLFEVQMKDVGVDGVRGNGDDRSFVFQGVFVP